MATKFKLGRFLIRGLICFTLFMGGKAFGQVKQQTMAQIQKLIAEKKSRTPAERKISSQLLQATKEAVSQPMTAGVLLKPANVHADASGNLEVDINATVTKALLAEIKNAGGKVMFSSAKFHSIRAKVNLSAVKNIAGYSGVRFIKPAAIGHTVGGNAPVSLMPANGSGGLAGSLHPKQHLRRPAADQRAASVRQQLKKYMLTLGTGAVNSEGDHTMGADSARAKYGYEGEGIRIGVMSSSFNALGGAAADITSGDLPGPGNPLGNTTPVTVLQDDLSSGSSDEGRAMLQIVHDIAPKAQLFFATANGGDANFASNILALRGAPNNCDIIIDDESYFDEPGFQDGLVAQAVNEVTANGALYFSSAGNAGSLLMNFASVWQGDFNDEGLPGVMIGDKTGTIHNFGTIAAPEIGDSVINVGQEYVLNWSDPLGASANDYDLFVVDGDGNIIAASTNTQDGTQDPIEDIIPSGFAPGYQVVVFKDASAQARAFRIILGLDGSGQGFKYGTTGQTFGHSGAVNAYCVAATPALAAYPGVFTSASQVEYFSSDGPRRIFFNADSTPVTPGNFLFGTNGGVDRQKPDITAPDGVSTNVHGTPNFTSFYGTSAAAPHAGAVAALLKSAKPSLTPAQIRSILTSTALDIEAPGYDINSGYGIVQAYKAMQQVNPAPLPSLVAGQVTAAEGSFSNHNGVLDPGEDATLVVQLINPSMANADSINAVLTTSTPGITIVQGSAPYGNIVKGGSATNAGTPFSFVISPSVPCGTAINFFITGTLSGGAVSPQGSAFTVLVGKPTGLTIKSQLGATTPAGAGYTVVSGQQTGRLSRGTVASSCASPIPADTLATAVGARQFDAYTFVNSSPIDQCINVTVTSANGFNIYTASYNNAGFVPSNPALNFVADPGQSATTMQYSFTAPAGKKYTIVVHDVPVLTSASGSAYTLSLSYGVCSVAPACTPVKLANTAIAGGATGKHYSQVLPATGGSGVYAYSITGSLPAGLSFSGDSLFGKPTQAGRFPIVVTVNDVAGCPSATQQDTLVISGDMAASVIPFAGTPQSTPAHQIFADSLKAKVLDASSKPLAGVNVVFTTPLSGATCSFNGGSDTVVVVTDNTGNAAVAVTANGQPGSYQVSAAVNGVAASAQFSLTNTCMATVVTNSADSGIGTLRYIVANACPDATVTFAPGINKITLTSGDVIITQGISINGPGATSLTISGGGNSRDFTITPANDSAIVNISGMTISDGVPQDTAASGGGGMLIYSGKVYINNCVISNNDATQAINAEGGGIDNQGAVLTVNNSSVVGNVAYFDGGGLALDGGSATINNSTISGNSAVQTSTDPSEGGWGGGIITAQALSVNNCTIYGNTAQDGGNLMGYFYNTTFTAALRNTIVAGGSITAGVTGLGPDIYGQGFVSSGFNLVQDTSTGAIPAFAPSDIIGTNPGLLPLANYGGTTPTLLPMPNAPVVNKGDLLLTTAQFDQRGYTRVAAARADIGSVEANYTTTAVAGTPQSAAVKTMFAAQLQAKITETSLPVSGITVMFNAPVTGAAGSFASDSSTATAVTGSGGIAAAPAFTANDTTGSYTVTAAIGGPFANAAFALTNSQALAVEFGRITADATNCTVQISWQTLTSEAGETFTVERSANGADFTPLYTVAGHANSTAVQTYNYSDVAPAAGTNFYRVKETNADGQVVYSHAAIAVNTCTGGTITAYPNPVHTTLTLVMPGTEQQDVNIYDASGRLVARYASVTGMLNINAATWAGGTYTVTVIKNEKLVYSLKIIKY